jgi:glycosyltransferase involved in cell wall biosynthesis
LNPVVASLVYSAAEQAQRQAAPGSAQRADIQHTLQFALEWLAGGDDRQVQLSHFGEVPETGGARGNSTIDALATHRRDNLGPRRLRIGLAGPAVGYGLAHQNRDIAEHLGIDRWLISGRMGTWTRNLRCRLDAIGRDLSPLELEAWLEGLDALLFVERPAFSKMVQVARGLGVCVVCVPNWEWLSPALEWLRFVDVMLCPTRHTARILRDWTQRFGFDWRVTDVSWPIDTNHFQFRQRRVCRRFVYVNGSGGAEAVRRDGTETRFRRKGLDVLLAAARQVPEIPFVVYAYPQDAPNLPGNVELRGPPADNRLLYCDGDVCVQPSHWEGLGLPLLECQAAGMPLITTCAPPMNEHRPMAVIPAEMEAVRLSSELCIPAARIEPYDLAEVLKSVYGRRIGSQSRHARRFVEREHSWQVAGPKIQKQIWEAVHRRDRAAAFC